MYAVVKLSLPKLEYIPVAVYGNPNSNGGIDALTPILILLVDVPLL